MAYKALKNISCSSITEVFRHIKDFLVKRNGIADYSSLGVGWTVHDSNYAGGNEDSPAANDWLVLYSAGENGKQDLYYRIVFTALASSIIQTDSGLYWNAATNAWVSTYPSGLQSAGPTTGTAFNLYVFADLDSIIIVIGNGTNLYGRYFGLLDEPMHDPTIAITSGAVTAGTAKVITVDAVPASWAVGKTVMIRDNAHIEKTTITAISGNTVTMTLANGYASGSKIARYYPTFISNGNNFVTTGNSQITASGSVGGVAAYLVGRYDSTALGDADPDAMNSCHMTEYNKVTEFNNGGYFGRHRHILNVSATGITSGSVYADDATGEEWRALNILAGSARMFLFKEA